MYLKSQTSPLVPPQTTDSIMLAKSQDELRELMIADAQNIAGGIKKKKNTNPQKHLIRTQKENRGKITKLLRKKGGWVPTRTIIKETGISPTTIRNHLREMADNGSVQRKSVGVSHEFKLND